MSKLKLQYNNDNVSNKNLEDIAKLVSVKCLLNLLKCVVENRRLISMI